MTDGARTPTTARQRRPAIAPRCCSHHPRPLLPPEPSPNSAVPHTDTQHKTQSPPVFLLSSLSFSLFFPSFPLSPFVATHTFFLQLAAGAAKPAASTPSPVSSQLVRPCAHDFFFKKNDHFLSRFSFLFLPIPSCSIQLFQDNDENRLFSTSSVCLISNCPKYSRVFMAEAKQERRRGQGEGQLRM